MKTFFNLVIGICITGGLLSFAIPMWESQADKPGNIEQVEPTGEVGLDVGDTAPDLEYASPGGKEYKLSDLRGNIVLVDFWASWCKPCRRENPNLVSAYKKYSEAEFKDAKGFEIYSVSLDKSQQRWETAIAQDELKWDYHVSDLGGWNSEPASKYNIRSIPANVLLDKEGVIIAKNLRGRNLHIALDELVEKL